MDKIRALMSHLVPSMHLGRADITRDTEIVYSIGNREYFVLTQDEMDFEVKSDIERLLWAFNPDFLARFIDGVDAQSIEAVQNTGICEDLNPLMLKLVGENLDKLVEEAVQTDGYGHFLAGYDGEHIEQDGFHIFRRN